jgi:hypothetical protein
MNISICFTRPTIKSLIRRLAQTGMGPHLLQRIGERGHTIQQANGDLDAVKCPVQSPQGEAGLA